MSPVSPVSLTTDKEQESSNRNQPYIPSVTLLIIAGVIGSSILVLFGYVLYRLGYRLVLFLYRSVKKEKPHQRSHFSVFFPVSIQPQSLSSSRKISRVKFVRSLLPQRFTWKEKDRPANSHHEEFKQHDMYGDGIAVPDTVQWARPHLLKFRGVDEISVPMPLVSLPISTFQPSTCQPSKEKMDIDSIQSAPSEYSQVEEVDVGEAIGSYLSQEPPSPDSAVLLTPLPEIVLWGASFDQDTALYNILKENKEYSPAAEDCIVYGHQL
ncbi:hypothetical protein C8Q75DRAFT_730038 [Abortiporus biennis]|nr:hypothetical protein C8Q75DRAFT_730038 [Abortiporus biennis]